MRSKFFLSATIVCLAIFTLPRILCAQPLPQQPVPQKIPTFEVPPVDYTRAATRILLFVVIVGLAIGAARTVVKRRSYKKSGRTIVDRAPTLQSAHPDIENDTLDTVPKDEILKDDLNEKELIDRLGTPVNTFKPSRANMMAGLIVAILMIAGFGGGGAWLLANQDKPNLIEVACLLGLAMVGVAILFWVRSAASRRVLICPNGFIEICRGKPVGCYWSQISEVKALVITRGKSTDRQCTVFRQDGHKFFFTPNRVKGISKLIAVFASQVKLKEDV